MQHNSPQMILFSILLFGYIMLNSRDWCCSWQHKANSRPRLQVLRLSTSKQRAAFQEYQVDCRPTLVYRFQSAACLCHVKPNLGVAAAFASTASLSVPRRVQTGTCVYSCLHLHIDQWHYSSACLSPAQRPCLHDTGTGRTGLCTAGREYLGHLARWY